MKPLFNIKTLLCNDKQQVITDCDPYLHIHCITGSAIEGFDMQMLFDPFEKQNWGFDRFSYFLFRQ
jgi:hypothetical protein